MLRVVVDVNVFVSAVLTAGGTPHRLFERWRDGAFDLIVSPKLAEELDRVLARAEVRARSDPEAIDRLLAGLRDGAVTVDDPETVERVVARDPGDDYLVALARAAGAHAIVTGDRHLLELEELRPPAMTPVAFLAWVERLP